MPKLKDLPADSLFVTVPEAAHMLGVSEVHIRDLCREGKMLHMKVGTTIRVARAPILEAAGITEEQYRAMITAEALACSSN